MVKHIVTVLGNEMDPLQHEMLLRQVLQKLYDCHALLKSV